MIENIFMWLLSATFEKTSLTFIKVKSKIYCINKCFVSNRYRNISFLTGNIFHGMTSDPDTYRTEWIDREEERSVRTNAGILMMIKKGA